MDAIDFARLVDGVRESHPQWMTLEADKAPTPAEVYKAEEGLGAQLPAEYIEFIRSYGGGDFAFTVIYSLDPSSDLNIVEKNHAPWLSRRDFIAFSDNGAGDYFGFQVESRTAGSAVYLLDHESGAIEVTEFANVYEYLVSIGLRQ